MKSAGLRCKVFSMGFADKPVSVEKEINNWLEGNPAIEIEHVLQTSTCGINSEGISFINVSHTFFYKVLT
jgi:hypothetical protein